MDESTETSQVGSCCCDWRKTAGHLSSCTQEFVREDPAKAVGLALLGGVLLTVLPVGRLISALVRLLIALTRPVLLVLGVVKLYEEYQKTQKH